MVLLKLHIGYLNRIQSSPCSSDCLPLVFLSAAEVLAA
jgi:hypothetical protein